MIRQQRQCFRRRRIEQWRKHYGARPAWFVGLAGAVLVAIATGCFNEWKDIRDRLMRIETGQSHETATVAADIERLRRSINWRCPDACKTGAK